MERMIITWLVVAISALSPASGAQESSPPEPPADQGASARERTSGDSPRDAMLQFLEAARAGEFERAARYLDLGAMSSARREEHGPSLARKLKAVLDRTVWIDPEQLSDPAHRLPVTLMIGPNLGIHPHRPSLQLRRVPPARLSWHDSNLPKDRSLRTCRGGSVAPAQDDEERRVSGTRLIRKRTSRAWTICPALAHRVCAWTTTHI